MTKRISKVGRPVDKDGPRKRLQAVISKNTKDWLDRQGNPPGRSIDDLVKKAQIREDFDND